MNLSRQIQLHADGELDPRNAGNKELGKKFAAWAQGAGLLEAEVERYRVAVAEVRNYCYSMAGGEGVLEILDNLPKDGP